MSNFSKEEVIKQKKEAIKKLNNLLEKNINDDSDKHLKKASLISYWIKDYVRMIDKEETFLPTKNISYKRGNVIKLNFGFNIGKEYGGLHYAIVLDKNNAHNSSTVTVVPLTSIKADKKVHNNSVELGDEIYRILKIKYDTIFKSLVKESKEIEETINVIEGLINSMTDQKEELEEKESKEIEEIIEKKDNLAQVKKAQDLLKQCSQKLLYNEERRVELDKIRKQISHMKKGSIAIVNQVTTIDKSRIYDPRKTKDVLSGISLSEESMEKINDKVKELFVF